jgi:hypothetical protein
MSKNKICLVRCYFIGEKAEIFEQRDFFALLSFAELDKLNRMNTWIRIG